MPGLKRLHALTQGVDTPSTRFRWGQYVPLWRAQGLAVQEWPARCGAYPPPAQALRPFWGAAALAESSWRAWRAGSEGLCVLQRHLIATLHSAERLIRAPYVFDVDDAIFLGPRGASADAIARRAAHIVCGNRFLAEHFAACGPVTVLPTAVDTERFSDRGRQRPARPTLGWCGSSSGFPYLYAIEGALCEVLRRHPEARLRVVADRAPQFTRLPARQLEFRRWQADSEAAVLKEFSIGLMPLPDSDWARGKCSFKMLTYMATGLPCVVSPVGMNAELLALGALGLGPRSEAEWVDALDQLLREPDPGAALGATGRRIAVAQFERRHVADQLRRCFEAVHAG